MLNKYCSLGMGGDKVYNPHGGPAQLGEGQTLPLIKRLKLRLPVAGHHQSSRYGLRIVCHFGGLIRKISLPDTQSEPAPYRIASPMPKPLNLRIIVLVFGSICMTG